MGRAVPEGTAQPNYAALGERIKHLLTDNGSAFRSLLFNKNLSGAGHHICQQTERTGWLPAFLAYYNARRSHSALSYNATASRSIAACV